MSYLYPATDFDRVRRLLSVLGSFWAETYADNGQIESIAAAQSAVCRQTAMDLLAAADTLARETAPIFHRDNWRLLLLRQSERGVGKAHLARYDGASAHDAGLQFDVPAGGGFAWTAPPELVEAPLIMNRFAEPSLTWHHGIDYLLDAGRLVFRVDPFADARVATRPVYSNGRIVDTEAALWLFRSGLDYDSLYQQYGYVLGVKLRSSRAYRELLNGYFDAIVGGPTRRCLERLLSAISGVPLAREPQETVLDVTLDKRHRLVITDRHAYQLPLTTQPTVATGDVLRAGDSMCDALELIELNRGELPDSLRALALGEGFLASCYYSDLVFENKELPLEVTEADEHPSGFTFVKFGLGGFPADVERFFAETHERGIAASQQPLDPCDAAAGITIPGSACDDVPTQQIRRGTLAHLLDRRTVRVGEPTAAALPRTINPLRFLVENVLRFNASIVKIKLSGLGASALGLHGLTYLPKAAPPQTAVIVLLELPTPVDSVFSNQFAETVSMFVAMEKRSDDLTAAMVSAAQPTLKIVAGHCQ